MPIYEYQCAACGHQFETLQKISDEPFSECPDCGKDALKKLISASAFRLKGSGWYETDFKTGNKRNLAGDGAKADKADKSDKSDKTDKAAKADKGDKPAVKAASGGSGKAADSGS